jgi:benzoyl-CoA 2,3-dioxygenase component B
MARPPIPNNVGIENLPARMVEHLEAWRDSYLDWWKWTNLDLDEPIPLRWAVQRENGDLGFDSGNVKMLEYPWGIWLGPQKSYRHIPYGDHMGEPLWTDRKDIPAAYLDDLRRLIVQQGDTEPASVEQQRFLGLTAPSDHDRAGLFQVNVEEGRHLWAMVYLLIRYFGKDGRDESDALLQRRSGDPDTGRILGAFNNPIRDWLAVFCFTTFTDRDGKYQLRAESESAFEPFACTTDFMLREEAFHMAFGQNGIERVVKRTIELMKTAPHGDVQQVGGIPLDILQKYINEWYSLSLDLFGGPDSNNAERLWGRGLTGRDDESKPGRYEDHKLSGGEYVYEAGTPFEKRGSLRRAMNELLRDEYIKDCAKWLDVWNKQIPDGIPKLYLPDHRFNRSIGISFYEGRHYGVRGEVFADAASYEKHRRAHLPTEADYAYVKGLMKRASGPNKVAFWLAPPKGKEAEYSYCQ